MSTPTAAAAAPPEPPPVKKIPARSEVAVADTWDLSRLYPNDSAWEEAFTAWTRQFKGYSAFQGKLAESPKMLAECLRYDLDISRTADRLGHYAMLKTAEDQTNDEYQKMMGQFIQAASHAGQASSFIRPEILAMPQSKLDEYLEAPELAPYKLLLTRIVRFKPHTLGEKEERLLAMQAEMAGASSRIFRQLQDADMKFGTVANEKGQTIELTHSNFMAFQTSPDRKVREESFNKYYAEYESLEHTLAATLNSTVQKDVYYANARNYPTALDSALFPDNVSVTVYDNLIDTIHKFLPAVYEYFDVRRRKMGLKDIHYYDCYVPILTNLRKRHTWDQAVEVIINALQPLGSDYCAVLENGLRGRWCDRYENRGKQSGAFSAGSFDGDPYILINFKPDVLDDVFTLAHEGGHSMHSYYSAKTQPYAYYDYVIFVAEVASTVNETLLSNYLLGKAETKEERAYLLNREIDAIRCTIVRQTMFAEFEKLVHASVESNEPLTLDRIKGIYHGLLKLYFGPEFTLDPGLDLECLRIPHFYRAFYVYKYATGLSAAMALADRVTNGGQQELKDYLGFLCGGCSQDPLDLLRGAGVDMAKPAAIEKAMQRFAQNVKELDSLI
ncbi:MAG: oligoendopeptidase F [Pirellulales bacterium]|nr:oligoendopeptidase F [Pirellulales bacterium]